MLKLLLPVNKSWTITQATRLQFYHSNTKISQTKVAATEHFNYSISRHTEFNVNFTPFVVGTRNTWINCSANLPPIRHNNITIPLGFLSGQSTLWLTTIASFEIATSVEYVYSTPFQASKTTQQHLGPSSKTVNRATWSLRTTFPCCSLELHSEQVALNQHESWLCFDQPNYHHRLHSWLHIYTHHSNTRNAS